ncbi:hypothetical protein JOE33_004088 [Pseudomonas sp. PvP027]|uniref:hypothetical protein n=1 Tax=Pseudomonas TaxID=286 RepID=UPI0016563BB5|nr:MULTISPECIES: hypothetical protein [Pseudomonas]MBC8802658.1 hypothetical protein [Pseudomonas congelans]MBP1147165.1 hypothetical protein [Pseudomonas sp. PvP027]
MRKAHLIAALISVMLGGCASTPPTPTAKIDYSRQSYEGTRFEKQVMNVESQKAAFKADIDSCEAEASRHYQESIARSAQLSQLYGQALSPHVLAKMKELQVSVCMAGDKASSSTGKGWTAVRPG